HRGLQSFPTRRSSDLVFAGDADGEVRNAADEVGGAVQWVDDPLIICAITAAFDACTFFAQNAVGGVGLEQGVDDALFGGTVNFRSEEHTSELQSRENL